MDEEHHDIVLIPKELFHVPCELQEGGTSQPQMQKVPPKLKQKNNQQDYEPLVVSFGPYHHGKVELQLAEKFKPKALQILAKDSRKVDLFYNKVHEKINAARSCYLNDSTDKYNDSTFARMMLLDASFIINYIHSENQIMCNYLGNWGFGQVDRDMLLLENQIPFFILKLLMCLAYGDDNEEEMLKQFLSRNTFLSNKRREISSSKSENPLHLLAAYRLAFLPKQAVVKDDDNDERSYMVSFRSVAELKEKGIHFEPSTVDSLESFEFKSGYISAKLKVPVTIVTVHTKVVFSNLIAYEMSVKTHIEITVTNYVEFMTLLIDNPNDVKELREKKILYSHLCSDEDVVKLFKEIGPCGLYFSGKFKGVKKEIEDHYNNTVKTWLAELIHTYFRSPWTAVALFAATFLLVLTLLQTYYTIMSSS